MHLLTASFALSIHVYIVANTLHIHVLHIVLGLQFQNGELKTGKKFSTNVYTLSLIRKIYLKQFVASR